MKLSTSTAKQNVHGNRARGAGRAAPSPARHAEPQREILVHGQPIGPHLLYYQDDLVDKPHAMGN